MDLAIVGNLTKEPEMRFTPTARPPPSFAVAVNLRLQNYQTNTWEGTTSFAGVVAWHPWPATAPVIR